MKGLILGVGNGPFQPDVIEMIKAQTAAFMGWDDPSRVLIVSGSAALVVDIERDNATTDSPFTPITWGYES